MRFDSDSSSSEGHSRYNDVGSDNDTEEIEIASQRPPPSHATLRTTKETGSKMNISFLCNPGDEHINLRQPSNHSSSVQKRSWAKDSTCK
jgi:hypothetical protein